ncbi:pseudouridine synthase [Rubritalea marina]|uniref:pseudouridine synthase n=1 Tax=Rubritalea marina TaxID=361055 RepID=UPI000373368B|nr:pseudouridine synthase [Rubritalea marina]
MIIALNKPYGVLSQFNKNPDYPKQRTLADIGLPEGLSPIGRLDMDSEGLLLLSDDTSVEHRLLDPKHAHRRAYWVQVDGTPSEQDLRQWRAGGLTIRKHVTKPCAVTLLEQAPELPPREVPIDAAQEARSSWLLMELREGKNRQVRRMTATLGFPTLRLVRISIGKYRLDLESAPGRWKLLDVADVQKIWSK